MNNKKTVIALSGGGSGGHIIPLLSLAHELKKSAPDSEIIYIGHKGDNFDSLNLPQHDFDFLAFINGGKFRRYHGESLLSHLTDVKTIALNTRDFFRGLLGQNKLFHGHIFSINLGGDSLQEANILLA